MENSQSVPSVTTPERSNHSVVVAGITVAASNSDLIIVNGVDDRTNEVIVFNVNKAIMPELRQGDLAVVVLEHRKAFKTGYFDKVQGFKLHEKDGLSAASIIKTVRVMTLADAIASKHDFSAQYASLFAGASKIPDPIKEEVPVPETVAPKDKK
jgi:hypothetical protein